MSDDFIRFDEMFDTPYQDKEKKFINIKPRKIPKSLPWVDKYRPKKINDIIHQDEVIRMLKKTLKTGNLPHLLFYGPSGTGKTSTILAICRELFGPVRFKDRVIELNASDERGINIVRKKIIQFAKMAISNTDPKYPSPPYKIIILDEADAMTTEAQSALRKTMEDNSNITRFCFICNYINQIISPISSRCAKFRFRPLSEESMKKKLIYISKKEKIDVSPNIFDKLIDISHGDMRKSIMMLQNLKYIYKYKKKIDYKDIYEIGNYIPEDYLKDIWNNILLNKKITLMEGILDISNDIRNNGYPINNLLIQLSELLIKEKKLNDTQKSRISYFFGNMERVIIEGGNEYIQLIYILSFIKGISLKLDI
jgi:replication factor C subunit 2/4